MKYKQVRNNTQNSLKPSIGLISAMFAGCMLLGAQAFGVDYNMDTTVNIKKIEENTSVSDNVTVTFTEKVKVDKNATITNNGTLTFEKGIENTNGTITGGIINVAGSDKFTNKATTIVDEINLALEGSTSGFKNDKNCEATIGKLLVGSKNTVEGNATTKLFITGTGSKNESQNFKQGTLTIGTIDKAADFQNEGKIQVEDFYNIGSSFTGENGELIINRGGSNSGIISQKVIQFTKGTFDNTGSITTSGQLRLDEKGLILKNNNTKDAEGNTIISAINAGLLNLDNGTITGDGNLIVGDGSYNKSGTIEQHLIKSTGTFTNRSDISSDLLEADIIENSNSGSNITVKENAAIDKLSNKNSSANFTANGDASIKTLDNTGTVSVDGTLTSDTEITNGRNITAGNLVAKTIKNSTSASVFNVTENATIADLAVENSKAQFTVGKDAVIDKVSNSGTVNIAGTLTSSEEVINKGDLTTNSLNGNSVTNKNNLTVNTNATVNTLTNNGKMNVTGDFSAAKSVTNNGELNVNSLSSINVNNDGTISVAGNATIASLTNNKVFNIGNKDKASTLNVSGDISGNNGELNLTNTSFNILGSVKNQTINASENSVLNIANPYNLVNNSLALNNSTMNLGALNLNSVHFNTLAMENGTINIPLVDVDLANKTMGKITADNYGSISGTVNVQNLNIQNIMDIRDTNVRKVLFTDNADLAHSVNYTGQDALMTPILKYGVAYVDEGTMGNFVFTPGAGASTANAAAFNPAVLPSSVAAQAGSYTAMTEALNYSFRHIDYTHMPYPSAVRQAMINKYAISEGQQMPYNFNATQESGVWFQPYASFENMHLQHGPRVDVTSYGSLIGGDSEYKDLGNGWGTVSTAFAGYNGSSMNYSGVDTYQNGGVLGATQTFYKNNFFTAVTVSAGASVGEASTMYGHEDFTSLMAGIASKTGYNFEFKEGKFIIQPSWMMAYSFINTFDYTNAANVRIDSDPLHSIQLHPTIKFIGNIGGWQPYASVGMVWNILNDTKVTANDIRLPEMSIKPYVEYGVGIQKSWKDRFTGFGQAMLRNGGRNGIALTLGFRWALGKDGLKNVQQNTNNKVVLKHMK